jgi:DNA-binding transcriptional ArsR family regulator
MQREARPPGGSDPESEASASESPLETLLEKVAEISADRRDEILASLPEEKRQRVLAALGSLRSMTSADFQRAIENDRERAFGLPPGKGWIARRILAVAQTILRRIG